MPTVADISLTIGATDSIRVATVDLATGALTHVSPPAPPMHPFDAANQGTHLADGRYVFGSVIEVSGPGPHLKLYILDAARTTWTTVETDVELDSFDTNQAALLDADDGLVTVFYRGLDNNKRTLNVDIATGLSHAYVNWGIEADDEARLFEAPSRADGTWVLATTESEYVYRIDPSGTGGIWVNTGDTFPGADIDLTAAAYHADRGSVFVWGVGPGGFPGRDHYVREFAYPSGALANSWGPFADEPASFAGNGVTIGDYYAIADAHELFFSAGEIGVFRLSAGSFTTLPVVLDADLAAIGAADQVLMIPNTGRIVSVGGVRQRQIPGNVRQRQVPGAVRQRQTPR